MVATENMPLADTDVTVPCILVLIYRDNPEKRVLFFAQKKGKGALTETSFVKGIPISEVGLTSKDHLLGFLEGERHYLNTPGVGGSKYLKQCELPTQEELEYCKTVFLEHRDKFGKAFDVFYKTLFKD